MTRAVVDGVDDDDDDVDDVDEHSKFIIILSFCAPKQSIEFIATATHTQHETS